jgi:hypothetical protein
MANRERLRDLVAGGLDSELVTRREADGWQMVAVEWERDQAAARTDTGAVEVPFGYRVARDCRHLEEDPEENTVLQTIMRMVVEDRRMSTIAEELNLRGLKTRTGAHWTASDVFRLMPVLVERGPRIFSHPEWSVAQHA